MFSGSQRTSSMALPHHSELWISCIYAISGHKVAVCECPISSRLVSNEGMLLTVRKLLDACNGLENLTA